MAFIAQPLIPGMLYESAARLAGSAGEPSPLRSARSEEDARRWTAVREMGWTSVLAGEAAGGMDGTLYDVAAMVEGLARHDVSLPVIERCAAVPLLLRLVGDTGACGAILAAISKGTADVAWLSSGEATYVRRCQATTARVLDDGRYQLEGATLQTAGDLDATHYLVVATLQAAGQSDTPILLSIDGEQVREATQVFDTADDVTLRTLDLSRLGAIQATCLAWGEPVRSAEAAAQSVSALLVCVDSLSALAMLLEQCVAHLNTRIQFGVPLASFQSLRHKAVDVFVMYETARGLVMHACAMAQERLQDAARDIQLAKYYVGRVGRLAAEAAIQMHGAMGMSQELPAARLAKRIITNDFRYGDRLYHCARLSSTLTAQLASMGAAYA